MKKAIRLLGLLMAIAMVASLFGCGGGSGSNDLDPIPDDANWRDMYEDTVAVKLCVASATNEDGWPKDITGDYSFEDNVWTQSWKDELNIKTEIMWTANNATGTYNTRINLAITSDDLPDIITGVNYSQFTKLYESGKIRDLTDYYDAYASDYVKSAWGSVKSPKGNTLKLASKEEDGKQKLYGLAAVSEGENTRLIFIRDDWMKKCSYKAPTSMDDVLTIAKGFVAKKLAKYALPLYNIQQNGMGDMQAVANSVGAYPKCWIEDGKGGITYGSVQPEMKNVLQIYSDLYKQGMISKSFASEDSGALAAYYTSGDIGVIPGDSWLISWPLADLWTTEVDDGPVEWNIYPVMPMKSNKNFKVQVANGGATFSCVNINYKHPEVIFKLISFNSAALYDSADKFYDNSEFYSREVDGKTYQFWDMSPFRLSASVGMSNYTISQNVTAAIGKGENLTDDDTSKLVTAQDKIHYKTVSSYFKSESQKEIPAAGAWTIKKYYYGTNSCYGIYLNDYGAGTTKGSKENHYQYDLSEGFESTTMVKQWASILDTEEAYINNVISGKKKVSDFDSFVKEWNEAGGKTIIDEMSKWYKDSQSK